MWRFKSRFGKAFLEEFAHAYPDSASLLTPDAGPQLAYALINNKKVAKEINALEMKVAKRPEIKNKSYAYFDSTYSPETQELIIDLLKNKIELASKLFNCLPPKARAQIHKKAEEIDKAAAAEAESRDEEFKRDRKRDEERAKYFGLDTWRFGILMNVYEITGRANLAAS